MGAFEEFSPTVGKRPDRIADGLGSGKKPLIIDDSEPMVQPTDIAKFMSAVVDESRASTSRAKTPRGRSLTEAQARVLSDDTDAVLNTDMACALIAPYTMSDDKLIDDACPQLDLMGGYRPRFDRCLRNFAATVDAIFHLRQPIRTAIRDAIGRAVAVAD